MTPGTVLFDKQFKFKDGKVGEKLVVVLTDGTCGDYLTVKTTSKQRSKNKKAGCQTNDFPPNYYLPANSCGFKGESWILLEEVYELDLNAILQKKKDGILVVKDCLSRDLIRDILLCAMDSQDIAEQFLDRLGAINDKLAKL